MVMSGSRNEEAQPAGTSGRAAWHCLSLEHVASRGGGWAFSGTSSAGAELGGGAEQVTGE